MKKLLQRTQNNWLLYISVICILIAAAVLVFVIQWDEDLKSSRDAMTEGGSLILLAVGAVLMSPILEELCFRSFFTKKKWFIIIGSILLPGFIYSTANNYFGWISLVFFYSLFYWNYKASSKWASVLLIIISSLVFTCVHYKFKDFQTIGTYGGLLWRFAFALIAVWVTQNFGLVKSMLFHAVNNSIAVLVMVLVVQFPDTTKQTYEDDNMTVTWSRVPRFDNILPSGSMTGEKVVVTKGSVQWLDMEFDRIDSVKVPTEPFMNYNFSIKAKNKNIDLINNPKFIKDFLIKSKLIFLMKKD